MATTTAATATNRASKAINQNSFIKTAKLAFCALGIYTFFLTWSILQERITTSSYPSKNPISTGKFSFFIVLNAAQSLSSLLISVIAIILKRKFFPALKNGNTFDLNFYGPLNRRILKRYAMISIAGSLASPFGYEAGKYISFLTIILAKSCKLLPVALMNWVLYRRSISLKKFIIILMITFGVTLFMIGGSKVKHSSIEKTFTISQSLYGLLLILCNMLIDGSTNSMQDSLFREFKMSSEQMMFWMNGFSFIGMSLYLIGGLFISGINSQLWRFIIFISEHPSSLKDVISFALCGSMGQIFVFQTLEGWGSIVLVTITVTRKLFTILLSLWIFRHPITNTQITSLVIVSSALVLESFKK